MRFSGDKTIALAAVWQKARITSSEKMGIQLTGSDCSVGTCTKGRAKRQEQSPRLRGFVLKMFHFACNHW